MLPGPGTEVAVSVRRPAPAGIPHEAVTMHPDRQPVRTGAAGPAGSAVGKGWPHVFAAEAEVTGD